MIINSNSPTHDNIAISKRTMKNSKLKNSWVLSVKNRSNTKYDHHYFCGCGKELRLSTSIEQHEEPEILCPLCANDYFINTDEFENMNGARIWRSFHSDVSTFQNTQEWRVDLTYDVPTYVESFEKPILLKKELLSLKVKKDGSSLCKISYKSKIGSKYSLYIDEKVQPLNKVLLATAKEELCEFILQNKTRDIDWIESDRLQDMKIDDKFKYINFFLKNKRLKEHMFFFWQLDNIHEHTFKYSTQTKMLNFINNNRNQKSLKKSLCNYYENFIEQTGYYPYSDYVFSRTIENIDLLKKLYELHPRIKQNMFTSESFMIGIEFIMFLKQHYSEKQLVRLFTEHIQDVDHYQPRLNNWRDTIRMLERGDAFDSLNEHFLKVKLSSKTLHDEIVRVFHIVSYKLDVKEEFEYDDIYLSACAKHKDLDFRLPKTVAELSLWSKTLHNCMFGYSKNIYQKKSIIYGVYKDENLLYAVELKEFNVVQAKAAFNGVISSDDMEIINSWRTVKF